jgi:hypothetical protein
MPTTASTISLYVVLDIQSNIMKKDFASSHKGKAGSGIAFSQLNN